MDIGFEEPMDYTRTGALLRVSPAFGIGYGFVLMWLAFIATGAGHGTYVLLGIFSAPISLTQEIDDSLLAIPFWWTVVGLAAGFSRFWLCRILFIGLSTAHYVSLFWVLDPSISRFTDFSRIPRLGGFFWVELSIYCVGQLVLWTVFIAGLVVHYRMKWQQYNETAT